MCDEEVRKRTISHYQWMKDAMPQYAPTRMAELAPGVIAVEDKSGECDAMFDIERWQFTSPKQWERAPESESPRLKSMGLNVLEGAGRAPRVSTIEAMVGFAKTHLSPKGNEVWHNTPQVIEFE